MEIAAFSVLKLKKNFEPWEGAWAPLPFSRVYVVIISSYHNMLMCGIVGIDSTSPMECLLDVPFINITFAS